MNSETQYILVNYLAIVMWYVLFCVVHVHLHSFTTILFWIIDIFDINVAYWCTQRGSKELIFWKLHFLLVVSKFWKDFDKLNIPFTLVWKKFNKEMDSYKKGRELYMTDINRLFWIATLVTKLTVKVSFVLKSCHFYLIWHLISISCSLRVLCVIFRKVVKLCVVAIDDH